MTDKPCKNFRRYKGVRPPTCGCRPCHEKYELERVKRALGDPRGKCYVAAEALYHLLGGKKAGLTPAWVEVPWPNPDSIGFQKHWFLRTKDGRVLDPTAEQFDDEPPYHLGRGCSFLTKSPCKRTQAFIEVNL